MYKGDLVMVRNDIPDIDSERRKCCGKIGYITGITETHYELNDYRCFPRELVVAIKPIDIELHIGAVYRKFFTNNDEDFIISKFNFDKFARRDPSGIVIKHHERGSFYLYKAANGMLINYQPVGL